MSSEQLIRKVMEAVILRTKGCLASETGVIVDSVSTSEGSADVLSLMDVTAVVGVSGPISLLSAFSFETRLLDALFARYTAEIEVPEEARTEYVHATAGDLVNLIIGQMTTDLQVAGRAISLTPPVVFEEARRISRSKNARFQSALLSTPEGKLQISIIGPRELFDEQLNYLGSQ